MKQLCKTVYLNIRAAFLHLTLFFISPSVSLSKGDDIKRILIIRLDRIGDLVLSTPVLKNIRTAYPQAKITLLGTRLSEQILSEAGFLDEIIVYQKGMSLAQGCYDLVFDLMDDHTLQTAIIAYQTKAKYRAGFDIKGRGVFFNIKVRSASEGKQFIDRMLELLDVVGADVTDRTPELYVSSKGRQEIAVFLKNQGISETEPLICVHPGGHYPTQRWLPERFAALGDELIERYQANIVLLGSNEEEQLVHHIESTMRQKPTVFIGRPLEQWMALIAHSNLLVCNNSGALHMACALKTPTVSTAGPTVFPRWAPPQEGHVVLRKDLPCIGCNSGVCRIRTFDCMNLIAVEDALQAVERLLVKKARTQ